MSLSHIPQVLRHPVGRMSVRARWYLASMVVLMAVFLAAHFSAQIYSQQQAEIRVQQWVDGFNVKHSDAEPLKVGLVRFHMMRGALTLRDVRWSDGEQAMNIPFLLLQGTFLEGPERVFISLIQAKVNHLTLRIHDWDLTTFSNMPEFWQQLWGDARRIEFDIQTLAILNANGDAWPYQQISLSGVHALSREPIAQRDWQIEARSEAGRIQLTLQSEGGHIQWQALDSQTWFPVMGFRSVPGTLRGDATWKLGQLWGEVMLRNESEEGSIRWQGIYGEDQQPLRVQLKQWPIRSLIAHTNARLFDVQSGQLNVELSIAPDNDGWLASAAQFQLAELSAQQGQYHIADAAVSGEGLQLHWPQRTMEIQHLGFTGGEVRGDDENWPFYLQWAVTDWHAHVNKLDLNQMTFAMPARGLKIEHISGSGSWNGGAFFMSLENDTATNDAQSPSGSWSMQLNYGGKALTQLALQAEHLPLMYFRQDLPTRISEAAALSGELDIDMQGTWDQQWAFSGDVRARDLSWQRGGWQWQADALLADGVTAFISDEYSGRDKRQWSVKQLTVSDWHVLAPLVPFSVSTGRLDADPYQPTDMGKAAETEKAAAIERATAIESETAWLAGWQVNQLLLRDGTFSLGQAESIWGDSLDAEMNYIGAGQDTDVSLTGNISAGRLNVSGKWNPAESSSPFALRATLDAALPFTLNDWLRFSSLPTMIHGRVSTTLQIQDSMIDEKPAYQGTIEIRLDDPAFQQSINFLEGFVDMTGYSQQALLDRLKDRASVQLLAEFAEPRTTFHAGVLGEALMQRLKQSESLSDVSNVKKKVNVLSRMRLHMFQAGQRVAGYMEGFSHNERTRLRQVISQLNEQPESFVELVPQLGEYDIDARMIELIRQEQQRIEAFLSRRGIASDRIIPLWPQAENRNRESAGIRIQAVTFQPASQ